MEMTELLPLIYILVFSGKINKRKSMSDVQGIDKQSILAINLRLINSMGILSCFFHHFCRTRLWSARHRPPFGVRPFTPIF